MKIKNKEEVSIYIKEKMREQELSQIGLAERLAEMSDGLYTKDQLRDNVSKWCRGERYPGVDYLYALSRILKVSIEQILIAGETWEKYDNRVTLYSVGKCCNENVEYLIDKLVEHDEIFINYDEFDKTLLDYILDPQNDNIYALRHLFNIGAVSFNYYGCINTRMRIMISNQHEYYEKTVCLCLKYDEIDIFKAAVLRMDLLRASKDKQKFMNEAVFSDESLLKIFEAKRIYRYLTTPYKITKAEIQKFNQGVLFKNKEIAELAFLPATFNRILHLAILHNKTELTSLIDIALQHNKSIAEKLVNEKMMRTTDSFIVSAYSHRDIVSVIASICDDDLTILKKHSELYEKATEINNLRDNFAKLQWD